MTRDRPILARVLLWALALLAPAAPADPRGVRLSYSGDPARTIAISWNSDSALDNQVQ